MARLVSVSQLHELWRSLRAIDAQAAESPNVNAQKAEQAPEATRGLQLPEPAATGCALAWTSTTSALVVGIEACCGPAEKRRPTVR